MRWNLTILDQKIVLATSEKARTDIKLPEQIIPKHFFLENPKAFFLKSKFFRFLKKHISRSQAMEINTKNDTYNTYAGAYLNFTDFKVTNQDFGSRSKKVSIFDRSKSTLRTPELKNQNTQNVQHLIMNLSEKDETTTEPTFS